jgi:pimeloyl-ACP methyl ester carboxylesterase
MTDIARLDPRETHLRIPSPHAGLTLFLRHLPPPDGIPARGVVLYVHGGTFPSALSIAHRFDGSSWRDSLCEAGFHVWGLDFHGFGHSAPCPVPSGPFGFTQDASRQLEHAVYALCRRHDIPALSLVAHSWGSMVAGIVAERVPERIERMVYFGPIARRVPADGVARASDKRLPDTRLITVQDQWDRFTADVPFGEPAVLCRRHFAQWGEAYLDSDPASRDRDPPAVLTPGGPFQDIYDAWDGGFPGDPRRIRTPVAIIRGEWDSLCTDADAAWLRERIPNSGDLKIARATHLMHLEQNRYALYRAAEAFLTGKD